MAENTTRVPSACLNCGLDPFVAGENGLCTRCGAYPPEDRVPASRARKESTRDDERRDSLPRAG